ncbi:hypothetical protein ACHAWC_008440 [Mediolabrus comicus]
MPATQIKDAKVSIAWKSFQFDVKFFKDLPATKNHCVSTPKFSCNGHDWDLMIYPGGDEDADEGWVSIYLHHRSEGSITASFELTILDKLRNQNTRKAATSSFEGMGKGVGWSNFVTRPYILDKSKKILDSDGTFTVGVSMKEEPSEVFVPKNPLLKTIQGMFLDRATADVYFEFEVCHVEAMGERKKAKVSIAFPAHSQILQVCAPMLANLFGSYNTATITDIRPHIFHLLLYYVYGGSVPEDELRANAKDIIDAADKYSIVNLKLEAEAAYVKANDITMDNAMDNLLYADAKNCALLKEAVMNFLAENSSDASEKISFNDVPGHLIKDLLVAFSRNGKKDARGTNTDELTSLSVSDLRRKLAEKGLDVDGSREAMIESIQNSS